MGQGADAEGTTPAKVPVTLLCGLQGSGKGALLKHFLEEPHPKEASMRLAVIVNDLEQIDIDEKTKLTEQSDDEVMEMVNGSVCCKLENDLVEQIIKLTQRKEKRISHIIIEASGVSEPHEIAPLFEIEDSEEDDSDGEENAAEAEQLQLADVARLDACVAVIDSAEFDTNLGSMRTQDQCLLGEEVDDAGMVTVPLPELMMDHLEFANIIVLCNLDKLQCGKKTEDLKEKLTAINTNAKIVEYNKVGSSVSDFLNTNLYKDDLYLTKSVQRRVLDKEQYYVNSIMIARCAEEERERLEKLGKTPDIKPFVYRARKPFHPDRFRDLFLEPFFMDPNINLDEEEEEEEDDDDIDTAEEENIDKLQKIQDEADAKQKKRTEMMGDLLRSKGFFWLANSHDILGSWQQAGNILRVEGVEGQQHWMCLETEWEGGDQEDTILDTMRGPGGEQYEYRDRRQEIVFIGRNIKENAIQELLDSCILTDEEMALGPTKWKETMETEDSITLDFDGGAKNGVFEEDDYDDEEEEEDEEDDEESEDVQIGKNGKRKMNLVEEEKSKKKKSG